MARFPRILALLPFLTLVACASPAPPEPADAFMARLQALCGRAFAGRIVTEDPADASFAGQRLVMHVRQCSANEVRIPFHVGDDRSRTWIVTRTATGLRLKHDHRHADGSRDEVTFYGGDTAERGTDTRQRFPADAESVALFRATGRAVSVSNVWSIETTADGFTYGLDREGRHFRVTFDYANRVPPPPAPWGW